VGRGDRTVRLAGRVGGVDNGAVAALPDAEVAERLARLPGWERVGDEIVRAYQLESFRAVIELVDGIADAAEAADHHPDLDIRYRTLRVALSTHSEGGITARDFALAGEIDALAR
jgi:4a-hydroxytetrahydrobiopterin dehydratase